MTPPFHTLLFLFMFVFCLFGYLYILATNEQLGKCKLFTLAAFDMEIHLPQQSETMQLYYLAVKHAAAVSPICGNEVFLQGWRGWEDWQ